MTRRDRSPHLARPADLPQSPASAIEITRLQEWAQHFGDRYERDQAALREQAKAAEEDRKAILAKLDAITKERIEEKASQGTLVKLALAIWGVATVVLAAIAKTLMDKFFG